MPSIMHFGTPLVAKAAPSDSPAVVVPEVVLGDVSERASGRDRAMTYAIAVAKEGETSVEELVTNAKLIYTYLYTDADDSATAA